MKRPLTISDEQRDFIRHLPPGIKKKIRQALEEISENPLIGKALREELEGLRSYKLGRIRVVYRGESSSVAIIAIGPRSTIYAEVALEIRRNL